ncbi:glycoside hydrolase family 104 protein [Acinetobacter sp. IRS14]|uniref:glycoside hydrolase family 24 protein n=1 Tax=Acinetobacter sp. IRS14 TaxID=2983398 RepID=UPI002AFF29F1|nr:glycoside hydrolase family 104 protein [Acinetobacter sp. IRS14]MEA1231105.1 glycoside hydrolase family 104 protein [Acinetobacter sp. IRS14]
MATRDNYEKLLNAPNVQKMLNLIASAEGVKHDYNTLFGNERVNDLSWHPGVKKGFTQTDGKKNATTAAGRYQFLEDTWNGVAKQLGLKDFSPKNQDIAAVALLAQNGALPSVLKGDFKTAIQKSGSTWASLPSSPYAQPKRSWSDLGMANPAREQYQSKASDIVAAYKKKQQEQEAQAQPKVDARRAQRIVEEYQKARQDGRIKDAATQPQGLPDFDANGVITYEQPQATPKQPELSLADKALGLGETALSAATGATGGTLGMLGGTLGQAGREILSGNFGTPEAAQRISQNAAEGAADLTYAPRTQIGQEYTQALGEISEPLAALTPALSELALVGQSARGVAPIAHGQAIRTAQAVAPVVERAGQAVQRPIQATANIVRSGAQRVGEMVGMRTAEAESPAPANVGAAQVDQATIRQAMSQELPYPVQLTEGQMTRDPAQLKFEVETSKDAELGAPLRQRQEEQHQVMQQNIDAFIDMTGAQATNMRETGIAVDKALQKQLQADKNRVRVAYAKADKSEEAQTPVDLTQPVRVGENEAMSVIDYLNSQPDLPTTPILTSAKRTAESLGIAIRGENGELIPNNPTIKQMEKWRQEINANTNQEAPNIRQTAILKDMIDQHVEPVVGNLYKAARNERKRMADHWESRTIIRDLTTNKTGTDDRRVALEDIQKRIIHDGSLDDLRVAKRTLLTSGDEGKQAWRDIQGQTLQEIKNAATAGVAPDAQGNQMISAAALNKAIKRLDDAGKLDYVFGPQGAEKLRAINEISKTLFTTPASAAINHSNTAATLAAAMDIAMSGLSGFPAPVASALRLATKHIKDNKVRARVTQALKPRSTKE